MAIPELGAKQICPTCQAKFYDLGRRPAVCPKCHASFDPEEAVRSRRVRSRTLVPDYEADDEDTNKVKKVDEAEEGFEEEADETPEIDEAAEADPIEIDDDAEAVPGEPAAPDVGVGFEEDEADLAEEGDDGVPFIEDQEDEDFPDDDIEGMPEDEEP